MVSLPIVLLILMSSGSRDKVLNNKIIEILKENNLSSIISDQNFNSPANDLKPFDIEIPQEVSETKIIADRKMVREKTINDKNNKEKTPVPLYSLVKNDCGKGYVMDDNGVCQKVIMARSEKTFDLERRKRHVVFPGLRHKIPFYKKLNEKPNFKEVSYKYLIDINKGKMSLN